MYHCLPKSLLIVLLTTTCFHVSGQTTTSGSNPINGKENNPYSQYGIGELRNGNNVTVKGMGNITSAYVSSYNANTDNPASYSFLQRTTFEVAANASTRTVHGTQGGTDISYKTGTASIAYMNFAVPVGKNAGLCFGFRPYASSYSRLQDSINANSNPPSPIGTAIKDYKSEGSLNDAFIGASAKFKGLSIGFNAGYMFGGYGKSTVLLPYDKLSVNNAYYAQFVNNVRLGGIHWKGGLMYQVKIDSTHILRIGGTVTMGQKLKEHYSEYQIAGYGFTDTLIRDTSYSLSEVAGKMTLPLSYSAGIMFAKPGKWGIGLDYTATQWNLFNSELNSSMNTNIANSSYKIGLGGEYMPGAETSRRYLSRATYRVGAYYGTDYLQIQGYQLPYYGVTAGMSLPFKRSLSQLHAAIDAGVLGTTDNGLMRHNYIRFTLGISLNDLWFQKKKLD